MQSGDELASTVFWNRYYRYARNLAFEVYIKNRNKNIDFKELQAVAYEAAFLILHTFNDLLFCNFYPYWKKVAERLMVKYVMECSNYHENNEVQVVPLNENYDLNYYRHYVTYPFSWIHEGQILQSDFDNFLKKEEDEGHELAIKVLILVSEGYSIKEISLLLKINETKVKNLLYGIRYRAKKFFTRK